MFRKLLTPIQWSASKIQPRVLADVVLPCLLGALFLFMPGRALAQATGQISGVVTDPSGGVLANAKVELMSAATAQVRTTTSGSDGAYTLPFVNPGTYQVRVSAPGFSMSLTKSVEVLVNGTTRVDAKLVVGSTSDEVTVTGVAPLVETGNATMGNVVDHEAIVDLPLNGRNFAQLGTLIPGVVAAPSALGGASGTATPGGFGNSTGSFNVNGMRNQSNNFLLDGAPNNDSFNSGFVMRPPPDAIEEFKIMTHSYDAQYGRSAGSVVNVVTRAGTNTWHGSAWEFNRISALAAKNYFAGTGPKPVYLQNQFGAAAGGKIIPDKLFVFGFYEGFRLKDATSNTLNQRVLTAAERNGDFSQSGVTIRDPLAGGAQFNYLGTPNRIDPARISSISRSLLSQYVPLPNSGNQFVASPANIDNRDMYGVRGDLKLGSHSILGRYMYSHQNLFGPITPSNFAPTGNLQIITLQDGMGSDTWIVNSHMINVARYARQWINGTPNKTSGIDPTTQGFAFASTNVLARGLPNITTGTGFFTLGDAQQPFASRTNSVDTISDDFTWTKGRHLLQFGGEARRDAIGLLYINRPNGAFTFSTTFTGYQLSDFLLGYPTTFQQGSGDPSMSGTSWNYSGYAQDQFRINPRLTVVVGARYEVNKPYTEAKNHLAALHPGQQSTVQPNAPLGLVYPGDTNTPRATYYADTNNISPRIAAIFDPAGDAKTVFRIGWGIYFDTIPGQGDFFQNGTLAPPFQPLQQIDINLRPANTASPTWFANPYAGVTAGPVGFPAGLTFIGWSDPHSYKAANIQHYNLSMQHQFTAQTGMEIAYVGSQAKNLPIFIEVNPTNVVPAAATSTNAFAGGTRAVFPSFALTRPTFSAANSWYDSLQARFTVRRWHRATATAAYTWSHAIDDVSGLNIGNDSRPILPVTIGDQHSIDLAMDRERGNALFDTRNRFVLSYAYELPRMDGRSLAERLIVGGWQFNGIFQVQSGNPFTAVNSTTTAQSLTFRPNLTCDPNSGPKKAGSTTTYINISCFALPTVSANGAVKVDNSKSGNSPRGTLVGPGFNTTDASLFKIFRVTENQKAEFRFEVFNVFNEAHFAQPNLTFTADTTGGANFGRASTSSSSTFGRITSTVGNDSRVIQLAAKYSF
ncbi:TonB-dependent receptor [Granulicella sp. dw_53]|uniref:TonB-dependent receptor n=1 Tax=Granulicella sp. dw_53 TaxID=2719792 RepID=UPI001BD43AD0|nr:TonB-dependent receptor [Granulicella sp. dw_53]